MGSTSRMYGMDKNTVDFLKLSENWRNRPANKGVVDWNCPDCREDTEVSYFKDERGLEYDPVACPACGWKIDEEAISSGISSEHDSALHRDAEGRADRSV